MGGHGIANFFRGGRGVGYLEILHDALEELGISNQEQPTAMFENSYSIKHLDELYEIPQEGAVAARFKADAAAKGFRTTPYTKAELTVLRDAAGRYAEQCELSIVNSILQTTYSKMSADERSQFDQQVVKVASQFTLNKDPSALTGTAGLMVVANLGGFATYTLMSSVLSAISLGTLGFGAYTAASSLLSVVIGPVGWLTLGAVAAYKFGRPELNKTIPFIATTAMIRQRIKAGIPAPGPLVKTVATRVEPPIEVRTRRIAARRLMTIQVNPAPSQPLLP